MPLSADRQRLNGSKPLTPALSSNFRNGKPGLTPRLAGSGSGSTSPSVASRKEPLVQVRSRSPGKNNEREGTPLSTNITPRSGARSSRYGTESPSTPAPVRPLNHHSGLNPSPPDTVSQAHPRHHVGIGISTPRLNMSTPSLPNPNIASAPATTQRRISAAKSMVEGTQEASSSKFFHANQVKPNLGSPRIDSTYQPAHAPGRFFVGSPPLATVPSAPQSPIVRSPEQDDAKFFRADDIPQQHPPKRPLQPYVHLHNISIEPSADISHTLQNYNSRSPHATPPPSPVKTHHSGSANMPSSPPKSQLKFEHAAPPFSRAYTDRPKSITSRTALLDSADQNGHKKSTSASSITNSSSRRLSGPRSAPPQPLDIQPAALSGSPRIAGVNMLSPEALSPRSISLTSSNTMPTSANSDAGSSDISKLSGRPNSLPDHPTESVSSPQPQLDGAANARRERKVLDLEISNSSLLAINKTLERELRKQSVELRRFRRLSRSGRLSLAPTTRSMSGQSAYSLDTVTEMDGDEPHLSDGEDESDFDEPDDEDGSILSNESGSLTGSSARSRQRARDEKRLMLDLSKHQQLLIDSQKLSQSIKRCMTCTEELIRDGNKALEYRVGIGDVKLGGRVLNDEELDERGLDQGTDEIEFGRGLLSPSLAQSRLNEVQTWDGDGLRTNSSSAFSELEELTNILDSAATEISG
ncbi:hypothetical protein B0A52_02844 [Exophiala mesophila]|uniref:Uncharacterized protein n=1 Tax=Exophiala mesophila TaxID=212818 RepID=A0A438NDT5_EXOME|nr:hypothetical protein B0A52_02844 [Exophiala mesophila]